MKYVLVLAFIIFCRWASAGAYYPEQERLRNQTESAQVVIDPVMDWRAKRQRIKNLSIDIKRIVGKVLVNSNNLKVKERKK